MGRRGPPPAPSALKLLKGNPGKRAINHDEPKLPASELKPPAGMSKRAKQVWAEFASGLITAGVLKASDRPVFRVYCDLVAEVEKYTKLCTQLGPGNASRLGYPKRLDNLRKQMREYSAVLGLNPSARSAIKATPQTPPGDESEDFLFGKKNGNRAG